MKSTTKSYNLNISITIGIAPHHLSTDVAMLDLLVGVGDKNNSRYTNNEFIKMIKAGNVIVAMLENDPIAYATVKENVLEEIYVSYSFKNTELESLMREFVKEEC
ncbi:hypothetical protein K8R20_00070 [bacterium]|nr:hypothetical protein [bacterium]